VRFFRHLDPFPENPLRHPPPSVFFLVLTRRSLVVDSFSNSSMLHL
jgi:hypothetical protein